jgi:hypothetical protein
VESFDMLVTKQLNSLHASLVDRYQGEVSALRAETERLRAELAAMRHGTEGVTPQSQEGSGSGPRLSEAAHSVTKSEVYNIDKFQPTQPLTPVLDPSVRRKMQWRDTVSSAASAGTKAAAPKPMKKQWSDLNLRPAFQRDADPVASVSMVPHPHTKSDRIHAGDVMDETIPWRRRLVTRPLSRAQLRHDVTNLLVMTWDLSTIPMEGAGLLIEVTEPYKAIRIAATLWWTLEMSLNFCRGYLRNGVVEMRLAKTASAYVHSWFPLDMLLVLLDWCTFFLEDILKVFGMARGVKLLRISRLVRLLRLIRLIRVFGKFPTIPPELARCIDPDMLTTFMRVMSWIVAILFLNHLIACAWYGLGSSVSGFPTWVKVCEREYLLNSDEPPRLPWFYATSLHWTLTQFTPASMEVVPENTYERFFAVCTILCAIIFFSSFLSSIATAVALFRRKRDENHINNANLIRFLQENHVSLDLAGRIQAFLSMQQAQRNMVHRVHESTVPQLKQLSEPLKEQLALEVYMPVITMHPLFCGIRVMMESCVTAICLGVMSQQSVLASHQVFSLGDECRAMYFVVAGETAYFHGVSTKPITASQHNHAMVTAESWVCEYVLLVSWEHQGLMTTMGKPCELALLGATAFQSVLLQWPSIKDFCRMYAQIFMEDMQHSDAELSDLPMDEVDARNIAERAMASQASQEACATVPESL